MIDNIKAKGDELLGKFYNAIDANMVGIGRDRATLAVCIIAVEEIIKQIDNLCKPEYTSFFHGEMGSGTTVDGYELKDYWYQILNYLKNKQ